jgi:hypothetical protein
VTIDEFQKSRAAGPVSMPRAISPPDAPAIQVISPNDPDKPIKPPVTIRVKFQPQQGARIDLKTFQALYGFFAVDITSRLLEHANVTPDGIVAENVALPTGEHKVTLEVADTQGRMGSRTFRFTVT